MFAKKTTLKQSIEIVADPAAEEVKWLAACTLLGDKPVEPHKPSPMKRTSVLLAAVIGSILTVLNCIMAFVTFCMLSGDLFCGVTHMDVNWFMSQTRLGQVTGLVCLLFGGAGFWAHVTWRRYPELTAALQIGLIALGAWTVVAAASMAHALVSVLSVAAFYVLGSLLSRAFVKGLPRSFQLDRSIILHGLGSAVFGTITAVMIYQAMHLTRPPGPYSTPDPMSTSLFAATLAFTMIAPAVVCASATKCPSRGGVAFLNFFFQAPLFSAMIVATSLCAIFAAAARFVPDAVNSLLQFFNFDALSPALPYFAGSIALCLAVMTLVSAALTAAGSALGTEIARSAAKSRAGQQIPHD
jgi:hypothetical protein